jgi:hypothetical protein
VVLVARTSCPDGRGACFSGCGLVAVLASTRLKLGFLVITILAQLKRAGNGAELENGALLVESAKGAFHSILARPKKTRRRGRIHRLGDPRYMTTSNGIIGDSLLNGVHIIVVYMVQYFVHYGGIDTLLWRRGIVLGQATKSLKIPPNRPSLHFIVVSILVYKGEIERVGSTSLGPFGDTHIAIPKRYLRAIGVHSDGGHDLGIFTGVIYKGAGLGGLEPGVEQTELRGGRACHGFLQPFHTFLC